MDKAKLAVTLQELGILPEEYDKIVEYLDGREPNYTELSIYSVMWSEHASYKNSIRWIKTLPREGAHLLVGAGEENAGVVDVGEGWGCAFKIESHNHPCAVEPYQGAATGVGGINRDIFTMGARPVAQLNSLRFGDLRNARTRWLLDGVVRGIGDYGNAFGVAVAGGEVFFDSSYETNPLVNAMSVGLVRVGEMISAVARGEGNPVFIVGSATGKDGIHGATFASANVTEESEKDIPSVQVGDPFAEKVLMEATLELAKTKALVGMQDMGAAGIICSTSEMSEKGGCGMRIDLDKVPKRQADMQPYEILLSESQERMLAVVKKGCEAEVQAIFAKWDISCVQIGEVTAGPDLEFYAGGALVARVPAASLVLGGGAPVYEREYAEPAYYEESKRFDISMVPEPEDIVAVARKMTGLPNVASKRWVYEQYDTMVGNYNLSINVPSDAGIVGIRGTSRALALTVDCNSRYVYADPCVGAMIAVAESARNVVCAGGRPVAITNCLNFGNPYDKEVYWQFVGAIKGMKEACEAFGTPVTGGNVSFYNQSTIGGEERAVLPTPVIGMLGVLEDSSRRMGLSFQHKGDMIYLLGESKDDISSSEYLVNCCGIKRSPAPYFNLSEECALQTVVGELITRELIESAHDVSLGGLFVTLLESSMQHELGFDITSDAEYRLDAFLFGEAQGRVVVSVSAEKESPFLDLMMERNVPMHALGHVTKSEMRVDDVSFGFVHDYKQLYNDALGKILDGPSSVDRDEQ
ncbi:MAG: phosphoribosylformylglycinamidine synthase subunit PurL [Bacteroidia bacterium]|nr:phosphoribosylformylglycinamidine synthase subunit PurL [Bacteroidia bacterium]